jgi:hypothetical protein
VRRRYGRPRGGAVGRSLPALTLERLHHSPTVVSHLLFDRGPWYTKGVALAHCVAAIILSVRKKKTLTQAALAQKVEPLHAATMLQSGVQLA